MIKMIIGFWVIALMIIVSVVIAAIILPTIGMLAPSFFANIATLSATLLGFTITWLSILIAFAFNGDNFINNLKITGHFKNLSENIYLTGCGFFTSMIAGLVSMFTTNYLWWLFTLAAFISSLICLFNAGRKFYQVIKRVGKPTGNPSRLG